MKKLSKLQQKLQASGQMKTVPVVELEDNSVMIEKMNAEEQPTEENVIMTIQPYEEPVNQQPKQESINLSRVRKSELLKMATTLGCRVTMKNTKRQIIAAIEKQSA